MPTRVPVNQVNETASNGRELWGTERFWHFAHNEHQGAFDMVSTFEVDLGNKKLNLREWESSWSQLSDSFPVLTQQVKHDIGGGKIESAAQQARKMVFSGPVLQDDQQRMDYCLEHRQFAGMSLTIFESNDETVHLAVTNPHALGDAGGVFAIGKALVESVASKDQASAQTPTASSKQSSLLTHPKALNEDLGLKDMFDVARKGSTIGFSILPKEDSAESGSDAQEWRRVCTFTATQTDALVRFCKANSLTVSAWLQATIYHAILDVLLAQNEGKKSAQRFTVPAMPFHHPTKKSGATSTICCPISVEIGPDASAKQTAMVVADSFALARRFPVEVQDEYVKTLIKFFSAAKPETSVPTFSSLGRLAEVQELNRYQVAARNNLPSMGIHAWTLKGQLNLSLSWAPARFNRDHIDKFWSTWISAIKQDFA